MSKADYEKKTAFLKQQQELRSHRNTIEEALQTNREIAYQPEGLTNLSPSEITRVEQLIQLGYAALGKYNRKLNQGVDLNLDEERMMLAHKDSIRKLETTLSALKSKADLSKKTDVDLAVELHKGGMDKDQVLALYSGNTEVEDALNAL